MRPTFIDDAGAPCILHERLTPVPSGAFFLGNPDAGDT
jgi:hypothetical protein